MALILLEVVSNIQDDLEPYALGNSGIDAVKVKINSKPILLTLNDANNCAGSIFSCFVSYFTVSNMFEYFSSCLPFRS